MGRADMNGKSMPKKSLPQPEQSDLLSQQEADDLLAMKKEREENKIYSFPTGGERLCVPLISCDKKHRFLLDIHSSRVLISKYSFQTRLNIILLLRLDIDGRPHVNPDGTDVGRTHIHRYRAGSGLDWAEPLPEPFGKTDEVLSLLHFFMDTCTIVNKPKIQKTFPTLFD
jgi:hypothetical protein